MEWKAEYSVGVSALDAQHKNLVRLITMLEDGEESDTPISYVFDELDCYVREHFRDEERMLEESRYPADELAAHKEEHKAFEEWLHSVRMAYDSGGEAKYYIADSVNAYLQKWLVGHILIVDMEYKGRIA